MTIIWFTENYPPNKGGMARSCDRIIANLRQHHTIHVYHFTNKFKAFSTQANTNGSYTTVPIFEDNAHTLNVLWAHINTTEFIKESALFVAYGSHLAIKGLPLFSKWLNKPLLTCIRGNDFDSAIFSQKKQDLLYCIEHSTAIACVTQEKVARIQSMQLNNQVFFTPNSIKISDWQILKSDQVLAKNYKANINTDKLIIGLVGYLKAKKGIDFFIDGLQKSALRNKVHLRIVGEIEPHIVHRLQNEQLEFSQFLPDTKTELIANYLICDAVAVPSIYDGMPNVIFEAAALNIPIIAAKVGGIPDVLSKNTAFLFNTLSEDSFLEALSDFENANNKELIEKTETLITRIKNEFSLQAETTNYLNIFNQIS